MDKQKSGLHMVTFILLVIGGLNWLLVGIFSWDIGEIFGGMDAVVSRIVYILIGLSAIYELATHKKSCACCNGTCEPKAQESKPEHEDDGSHSSDDSHSSSDMHNQS